MTRRDDLPEGIQRHYTVDGLPGTFSTQEAAEDAQRLFCARTELASLLANDPYPSQLLQDAADRLLRDPLPLFRILCPELAVVRETQPAPKGAARIVTLNPPQGAVVWVLEEERETDPLYTTHAVEPPLTLPWSRLPDLRWTVTP